MTKFIRKYFFIFLTFFLYFLFIYSFFIQQAFFQSFILLLFLTFLLVYFFLEIQDFGFLYFALILIGALILEFLIIDYSSLYISIALYIFHLGLLLYGWITYQEITNRKKISPFKLFIKWIRSFSFFLAISYTLLFIGKYKKFNLECKDIYGGVYKWIEKVGAGIWISKKTQTNIKNKIQQTESMKVSDILGTDVQSIQEMSDQKIQNLLSQTDLSLQQRQYLKSQLDQTNQKIKKQKQEWQNFKGFLSPIYSFVQNISSDKKKMNSRVCGFLVNQISTKYQNPGFKWSVIFFMSVLLWPIVRLMLFLFGILNRIFFLILKLLKFYNVKLVTDEVEEIS